MFEFKRTVMRNYLRLIPFLLTTTSVSVIAQNQPDQFVYAITSIQKNGTDWPALRKLNTQTGEFSTILINGTDKSLSLYDAGTLKKVANMALDEHGNAVQQPAFGNSVAAIAYDRATNRIYFTPMTVDQLRYIDLSSMKIFSVTDQTFSKAGNLTFIPGTISRMVIAPDGYGYTITNDGNHFFRFSTDGSPSITDLGELVDDAANNETIHNACGNAGGDLVADDAGSLYLISASNRVFKIDINSKRTSYLGAISGLPTNFSSNGAAVNEDGKLLLSSSVYTDGYFTVDPRTWIASPFKALNEIYSSADLANSNIITTGNSAMLNIPLAGTGKVKIFPNPISDDEFNVQFNNLRPGNYTVQLADATGNPVLLHKVRVTLPAQTETIHFSTYYAQAFYFLKVMDENNVTVNTQILVVER